MFTKKEQPRPRQLKTKLYSVTKHLGYFSKRVYCYRQTAKEFAPFNLQVDVSNSRIFFFTPKVVFSLLEYERLLIKQ